MMKPVRLALLAVLLVAACSPQDLGQAAKRLGGDLSECPGASTAQCYFLNSPVKLVRTRPVQIAGRSNTFYPMAEQLEFIDGAARKWVAPQRTLTDGASIPLIFVPIVGSPTTPEFVNAAAVHDANCGIGNEDGPEFHARTWQETHRMFYDTLIVGGTPAPKAKLMFAAVWLGGPRWHPRNKAEDLTLARLPPSILLSAMRDTRDYIAESDPSLTALLVYLRWQEAEMLRLAYGGRSDPPRQDVQSIVESVGP